MESLYFLYSEFKSEQLIDYEPQEEDEKEEKSNYPKTMGNQSSLSQRMTFEKPQEREYTNIHARFSSQSNTVKQSDILNKEINYGVLIDLDVSIILLILK